MFTLLFTFIKSLFSSFSLSAMRVVSCAFLRLLILLPAILVPACASSSLAFHMMCPAYKLNKQGNDTLLWHIPFPVWKIGTLFPVHCSMSSSNYCFLTCIQSSQEAGEVVWYSHLFNSFLQFIVIHTVRGFRIVSEAIKSF